jgi:type I restriction enzyme S subunit
VSIKLRPYGGYRNSGSELLPRLPEGWDLVPLKRVARINPRKSEVPAAQRSGTSVTFLPMENVHSDGTFDSSETKSIGEVWEGFTYFRRGDVIVAKITPCFENGKGASLERLPTDFGFGSTEFIVLRPRRNVSSQYLNFLVSLPVFRRLGADAMQGAGGQQRVPAQFAANFRFPIPPLDEQLAIVRFLRFMGSRIKRAVSIKLQLIDLLEEERRAVIRSFLTTGFDLKAPLKASGVDWLGDVPPHWDVRRLKWAIRLQRGYDLPADKRLTGNTPVVSSGGIVGTHVEARAKGPGVVMGRYGSTGSVYFVDRDFWPHNTSLYVTHFNGNAPEWAYYLLQVIPKAELAAKSAVPGIDRRDLHDIVVAVPPVDEQQSLINGLTKQTKKADGAIQIARRQVDLLREYRTRLISDVVTGKLDVREAAKNLPDDPDADDPALAERLEEVAAA